jgi:sulfate adenylyltransferase large subunit
MTDLLRFITCGSVDDGKSTLIGRLLYETNSVFDDQAEALEKDSAKFGTNGENLDFALLVDGLAAEREQGITIDVAYRYFSTPRRTFIVADTPGHEQYTRNMATGASTADLAILLIDARKGLLPQTKRHSKIVSMVGVKHIILAINKIDMVGFSEEIYNKINTEYREFASGLGFTSIISVPLSARHGDNLTTKSVNTPWYKGDALLHMLETADVRKDTKPQPFRFPVQWVNRPDVHFRGFAGTIASGSVKIGDQVTLYPSLQTNEITEIHGVTGVVQEASQGEAVTLVLKHERDTSRGDIIASANAVTTSNQLTAKLLWTGDKPLGLSRYLIKLASSETAANTNASLTLNDIETVTFTLEKPLTFTSFNTNKTLGSFIVIDPVTRDTVGMGMVIETKAAKVSWFQKLFLQNAAGDTHARSIAKAVTWRITGSLDTFLLSWFFTASAKLAVAISLTEVATKIVLYYGHERIWAKIKFGLGFTAPVENKDGAGI